MKKYNVAVLGNIWPRGHTSGRTYSWFVLTTTDGLQKNGFNVTHINYRTTPLNEVKQILKSKNCKVVFTHLSFHTSIYPVDKVLQFYRDIRKLGIKVVHVLGDARKEDRYMGDLRGAIDYAFVTNLDVLENGKKAWKIPTFFSPYCSLTYGKMAKVAKDLTFDIPVFPGHPTAHPDRAAFIKELQKIMKIKVITTQSAGDLRHRTPELSVSAKCILGLCTGYNVRMFTDVRPWQFLGTGAFMIMRKFKGMDDMIPSNLYIPFNNYSPNDVKFVKEQFNHWKDKDTSKIRKNAFEFMQKYHSSKVRFGQVMECIEEKRDKLDVFIKDLKGDIVNV